MGFIMGFITEYLKYLSITIFGFFILIYSPIIQADDPNKITLADVYEDLGEFVGQTIIIPGVLIFPDVDELSVSWEEMTYLYSYKNFINTPNLPINPSKLSKKQKKWIKSKCGVDLSLDGGCHVNLTIVVDWESIDAIHIEKMGMKDKYTNIAIGKKNELSSTVNLLTDKDVVDSTVDFFKDVVNTLKE
tara:strand:+ start:31 stop:597 length:567 start_codon:yes stop_codon:yes gene_type:complete